MDGYVLNLLASVRTDDLGVEREMEEDEVFLSGELLGGSSDHVQEIQRGRDYRLNYAMVDKIWAPQVGTYFQVFQKLP